jgi:TonB family C-terminal domain
MPRGWFLVIVIVSLTLILTLHGQEAAQHAATVQASPAAAAETPPAPAPTVPDSTRLEPIKTVQPLYPFTAEKDKLQGQVSVKFKVSQSGDVEAAEVVSGIPVLGKAAVDAVKGWKFKPFIKNGNPIEASSSVLFDFIYRDTGSEPPNALSSETSTGEVTKAIKVVKLSEKASKGLLLQKVQPVYPQQAKDERIQGKVLIFAVVSKDGTLQNVRAISGPAVLADAALAAVKGWRYRPYVMDGEPVDAQTVITVDFSFTVTNWKSER